MGTKLAKNSFPKGHAADDFECFGPPATKDGDFDACKIADMGCFTQDGKDSNKYYHGAVVKSKKTGKWFVYFEYGRTGATSPQFQFVECSDETDAQYEFSDQLHSKNDKRGEWATVAGRQVLRAKAGKDCYLVRSMATRSTGLPDAKKIAMNDGAKADKVAAASKTAKTPSAPKYDAQTLRLMHDMNVGTVSYTKTQIEGGAIPSQAAIDEARDLLGEAQKRVGKVGDNLKDQTKDKQLRELTYLLYSRVPKIKPVGTEDSVWILSAANIQAWQFDLDAYENALYATNIGAQVDVDPFSGHDIEMKFVDPKSETGLFINKWMPKATANRHGGVGSMKIKNIWEIKQNKLFDKFQKCVTSLSGEKIPRNIERPLFQPDSRGDVSSDVAEMFEKANVGMLFHGTRSVNVPGIIREGLRLPKQLVGVVITGAMFGPGVYWADDWKKSAGYTSLRGSYWSSGGGSVAGRHAFMFIADVALGNPHVASGPRGYTSPPAGHHCVFGKAGHSQVMNNEWIVFDTAQNRLRYLVEFDT